MSDLSKNSVSAPSGTLFIKDVDRIDCAVFEPSFGVVGYSWHVDIAVSGPLDHNGFVHDFSHIKKLLKQTLRTSVDHSLLIPIMSRQVHYQEMPDTETWILKAKGRLTGTNAEWEYRCPKGAVFPIRAVVIDEEVIEQEIARLMRHRLPATITDIKLTLREEDAESTAAFFRYTHGITEHEGLCQRLFHGHRSLIEIYVDNERRPDLEHYIAREVFGSNIHIASQRQIISGEFRVGCRGTSDEPLLINYSGSFGSYLARIPANRVFVTQDETSIESITRDLAQILAQKDTSGAKIKILCYEGIGKGAIAEA